MKLTMLVCAMVMLSVAADAQVIPTTSSVPTADEIPASGEIDKAYVLDVEIMTNSDIGPFTRFSIAVPGHTNPIWFYVRNTDNVRALERGAIIGLLMGTAESYRQTEEDYAKEQITINFTYTTVQGRHEIETASLVGRIQH